MSTRINIITAGGLTSPGLIVDITLDYRAAPDTKMKWMLIVVRNNKTVAINYGGVL